MSVKQKKERTMRDQPEVNEKTKKVIDVDIQWFSNTENKSKRFFHYSIVL